MTTTTPKPGDTIYLNYGCMCGDDFGTVIEEVTNRWGTQYRVRLSDSSEASVSRIVGTVTGTISKDCDGNPFMVAEGVKGIGAYLVR